MDQATHERRHMAARRYIATLERRLASLEARIDTLRAAPEDSASPHRTPGRGGLIMHHEGESATTQLERDWLADQEIKRDLRERAKSAEAERDALRAALAWYADRGHWRHRVRDVNGKTITSDIREDNGQRARDALVPKEDS